MEFRRDLTTRPDCDVLVAGGGIAGVMAAIASARLGARTSLVERHSVLGGDGTAGGVCGLCGDTARVNDVFADIVATLESRDAIAAYDPSHDQRGYDIEQMAFALQEAVLNAGVDLRLHTFAPDAVAEGRRLSHAVLASKNGLELQPARAFVDATGEADLVARAGFGTDKGGPPDGLQLPMSLYFTLWDTRADVRPFLPPDCPTWDGDEDIPMTTLHPHASGRLDVKMKVIDADASDASSLSEAELRARRQMMGLVYHLQTKGYQGKVYRRHRLAFVSRQIGIREGRRATGEYVLTEDDVRAGRRFDDAVAVGTYHIDYHWPDRLPRAGTGITDMVPPYHIPLRSLVPRGAENLLTAGRCISGDQMAMSSFRVMATCAQTGLAAGIAAALTVLGDDGPIRANCPRLRQELASLGQNLDPTAYGEYLAQYR